MLVRTNALADEFNGTKESNLPKKTAAVLRLLHRSASWYQRGNMKRAFDAAEAALGRLVVESEALTESCLTRRTFHRLLGGWGGRQTSTGCVSVCLQERDAGKLVRRRLVLCQSKDRGTPVARGRSRPETAQAAPSSGETTSAKVENGLSQKAEHLAGTVHSAKGRTLENVVLLVNPKVRDADCPSVAWWPPGNGAPGDSEERRVALVAVTRARSGVYLLAPDTVC